VTKPLPPAVEQSRLALRILRDQAREAAAKADLAGSLAAMERMRLLQMKRAYPQLAEDAAAAVRGLT
jgi:hypothetical protein